MSATVVEQQALAALQQQQHILETLVDDVTLQTQWQVIEQKIAQKETRLKKQYLLYWKVAAILVLVLTASMFWLAKKDADKLASHWVTIKTTAESKKKIKLPDETEVWLHYGASISYDSLQFNQHKRAIQLQGQAYFEVTKNAEKPFEIQTKLFTVAVLGTSFEVDALRDTVGSVKVCTGIVRVYTDHMDEKLFAGNALSYHLLTKQYQRSNVETTVAKAFKTNRLEFKNDNLISIVEKLNHWYHTNITIGKHQLQDNLLFTGSVEDDGLEHVLKGLSYLAGFSYKIDQQRITVYPQK